MSIFFMGSKEEVGVKSVIQLKQNIIFVSYFCILFLLKMVGKCEMLLNFGREIFCVYFIFIFGMLKYNLLQLFVGVKQFIIVSEL